MSRGRRPQVPPGRRRRSASAGVAQHGRLLGAMGGLFVVLTVIGIEGDHADRVLAVVERLHDQHTFPGTGAGLAICRRIAELHGGEIEIGPAADGGTRVEVTVPKPGQRNPTGGAPEPVAGDRIEG